MEGQHLQPAGAVLQRLPRDPSLPSEKGVAELGGLRPASPIEGRNSGIDEHVGLKHSSESFLSTHFAGDKTEAQNGEVTALRPHF